MTGRAAQLVALCEQSQVDAFVVTDSHDLRWLTGFTGSSGIAICGPSVMAFVTDFRYVEQAEDQVDDCFDRVICRLSLEDGLTETLPEGGLLIGFDGRTVTVAGLQRLTAALADRANLKETGSHVAQLREVKDPHEIEAIAAATSVADEALTATIESGLIGRTERAVAWQLEQEMRNRGAEALSFEPIVASGPHAALPHAMPRDREILPNQLVVIDWGAQLGGYCSDCTRTLATGDVDEESTAVYELVLRAQSLAREKVKPGITGSELDQSARGLIEDAGYGERFGHGLGHGVGLEVHEGPRVSRTGSSSIVEGNVITIEPGIYIPGRCGVRIEDLVVVTEDGARSLTALPREMSIVG